MMCCVNIIFDSPIGHVKAFRPKIFPNSKTAAANLHYKLYMNFYIYAIKGGIKWPQTILQMPPLPQNF